MNATSHPSLPNVYKSKVYREVGPDWNATLKVDHDAKNPFSVARLVFARPVVERMGHVNDVVVYSTAKGHHVRVWMVPWVRWRVGPEGNLPASTVLRLQALLGDDPVRQRFNRARVRRGESGWNVLWTSKTRNGKRWMTERRDEEFTLAARVALGCSARSDT